MASIAPIDRRPARGPTPASAQHSPAPAQVPTQAEARSLDVEVLEVRPVAHDAATFALATPGGRAAPAAYRPGQFITLSLPSTSGAILRRSYSLCGDGRADRPWEITVKRAPGGVVSNFLLDYVRPGMQLRASRPQGAFTLSTPLHPATPLVFVAAGSGITPIYGMLRALARLDPARRPRVWLHYAYHSPADAVFGRELAALDSAGSWLVQRHYVSTTGTRMRPGSPLAAVDPATAAAAEWYVCGPASLQRDLEAALRRGGVPAVRLHREVFASPRVEAASTSAASGKAAARLHLADSGATLDVQPGETLLESLERHSYRPDFSCRAGACGTCRLRLLTGQVRQPPGAADALTPAEHAAGYVLTCVGEPVGDVALASAGAAVAALRPFRAGSSPVAGARRRTDRRGSRRGLRTGLVAASLGLFVGVWQLTNHTPATASSSVSSATTSSSSSSGSSSSSNGSSSSSSGSNGSSSVSTQPSTSSSSSSSTGVS